MTDNGLPSWTAPSGRTYPPPPRSFTPPILPTAFTTYNEEDDEEADAFLEDGVLREIDDAVDRYRPDGRGDYVDGGTADAGSTSADEPDPDAEPPWLHSPLKPNDPDEPNR